MSVTGWRCSVSPPGKTISTRSACGRRLAAARAGQGRGVRPRDCGLRSGSFGGCPLSARPLPLPATAFGALGAVLAPVPVRTAQAVGLEPPPAVKQSVPGWPPRGGPFAHPAALCSVQGAQGFPSPGRSGQRSGHPPPRAARYDGMAGAAQCSAASATLGLGSSGRPRQAAVQCLAVPPRPPPSFQSRHGRPDSPRSPGRKPQAADPARRHRLLRGRRLRKKKKKSQCHSRFKKLLAMLP